LPCNASLNAEVCLPQPEIHRFDAVIFDCDGVLVDSEVLSAGSLAEELTVHGMPITTGEVIERFLGRSFPSVRKAYEEEVGRPLPEGFQEEWSAVLLGHFKSGLLPMNGIVALLRALPVPYCVASSSAEPRLRTSLHYAELEPFFTGRIFNAAMVPRGKPHPDLFLMAAEKLGADPARTLVLEDSASGVLAGVAGGMEVWGFVGGAHYRDAHGPHGDGRALLRENGASRVFTSMVDVREVLLGAAG
jgi:HAD superfamily hydrolase (TIGR01509 family)